MANGKNVVAQLEKSDFVATPADIEALTKEQLSAVTTQARGKVTYLRALIATTQNELGVVVRQRAQGHPTKLKPEEIKAQVTALETVHERFYEAVLKAIESSPLGDEEKPKSGRTSAAAIKTRRATFARSAKSTVKAWIKHGNDISTIAASKVTKTSLAFSSGQRRKRAVSAKVLVKRAEKQSKVLMGTLLILADVNHEAALKEYQTIVGQLSNQMTRMGLAATRDPAVAATEHRPLTVGRGKNVVTFVPTDTMVLRKQAVAA